MTSTFRPCLSSWGEDGSSLHLLFTQHLECRQWGPGWSARIVSWLLGVASERGVGELCPAARANPTVSLFPWALSGLDQHLRPRTPFLGRPNLRLSCLGVLSLPCASDFGLWSQPCPVGLWCPPAWSFCTGAPPLPLSCDSGGCYENLPRRPQASLALACPPLSRWK